MKTEQSEKEVSETENSIDTYEDFNRVLEELYEKEMSKQLVENPEE